MRFSAGIMQGMGRGFAGARRMLRPGQYARNLLILHTATHQDSADWVTVKQKIETRAPDIDVRVGSNDQPSPELCRWQVTRPSLVFSPFRLIAYRPPGGTIYAGREIGKIAEWRRMVDSGLPVPQTIRLVPELCLKPEAWGDYVIVKPVKGMRGRRVRLVRADEIGRWYTELTNGGRDRMLVQKYIDHVDEQNCPTSYRVITMFGEPILEAKRSWVGPRRPLAEIATDPAGKIASNAEEVPTHGKLVKTPDVLALARRVAAGFPEIPCLGQDILCQTGTGELYILEVNPGGAVWHFSSDFTRRRGDLTYDAARYAQFNALDVVADQLIVKTRTEAS